MNTPTILWVDDEIELLKPQILFLNNKGYEVSTATNGHDALEKCKSTHYDIVFLDEIMPGLSGLQTLERIKEIKPNLPVVMITKNEEENIMEEAIGAKIADYLIKPVKPNQILLSIKKILEGNRLVGEKTTSNYQQQFMGISQSIQANPNYAEWMDIYKKLVFWEIEIDKTGKNEMKEVLALQKKEANIEFGKFITKNYLQWLNVPSENKPVFSHNLLSRKVLHDLDKNVPAFFVLIDNLRYDQWKIIEPALSQYFRVEEEDMYYSILPAATQYCRNAIFAGLLPLEIEKRFPQYWKNDEEEGSKNLFEKDLFSEYLKRLKKEIKFSYTKITNVTDAKHLQENIFNLLNNEFNIIVYNFVDMLSHARTEMEVLKELASDETAYRSLTLSWFEHSPLFEALKKIAEKKINLIITTDHGTIRVNEPSKLTTDKNASSNLRYKHGKNMQFVGKDIFDIKNPSEAFLPTSHMNSRYIFAKEDKYFVYANNYNQFVNYYKNTFQHGGISLEEMLIPIVKLTTK